MANIFYNHNERRVRAGWRILIQGLIFFAGMMLFGIILGLLWGLITALTGGNLADLQNAANIAQTGFMRAANGVGSLLAMFLSLWIAARWLDRRPIADFGLHLNANWWIDLGFGLFLGVILMVFIFLVELQAGWITITGTMQTYRPEMNFWVEIISYVVLFLCVGIYEEMLSRGYHLRNMAEGFNFKPLNPRIALLLGYLISSSMFGIFHLGNANSTWVSTLNLIVAGLFLGLGYVLTGELAIPIGIHITWNFFQGNVFGFPVSGGGTSATFIGIQQGGPDLWTGGAFGPEAGLIGIAAIAIGCLLIALWVRWRYGEVKLKESLAVYRPAEPAAPAAIAAPAEPSLPTGLSG